MSRKKWIVPKVDKSQILEIAENNDIDPVTASLLMARDIKTEEKITEFCSYENLLCDPFDLKDMDKAVEAISTSIEYGEKITIYGDYDADGVTSTSVLYMFLEMLGADVDYYIPDRNTEGYGMNEAAIRKIAERGTKLIVTVDNGVSALHESEIIYELGMKLVITDHHKVPEIVPRAEALVDPHRTDNPLPFDEWSGAGVAFKLICAMSEPDEAEMLLDEYCDIISIGTVADVVSLTGENRVIVRNGVEKLNKSERPGIVALKSVAGIEGKPISSTTVAFSLVPRINAVGRVKHSSLAVRLLVSESEEEAAEIAAELSECNQIRQKMENEIMTEVANQIAENPDRIYDKVLVFGGKDWHSGVIGIVASRLVDAFGKPSIVISSDGIEAKGSGRSIEGFSLYDCINSASHLLTHFGGHTLAAGFGLHHEDIDKFRQIVNSYANTVHMPCAEVRMDFRLKPESITLDILESFSILEPFGAGNPQPLFGLYNLTVDNISPVGNGKHLRLTLSSGRTSLTVMKFSTTPERFPYKIGDCVDLAVRLEKNVYMGNVKVSIHAKEIKDAVTDDDKCIEGMRIFEKLMRNEILSPEERKTAMPSREDTVKVYKYIKTNGSVTDDIDAFCYHMGSDGEEICKYAVSLKALEETGLINRTDGIISLTENQCKVVLTDAPVFKKLEK